MKTILFAALTILLHFTSYSQTIIMQKEGGVYTIPCTVNGLKLKFIFDTGASSVSISLTEAVFMLKNGYLDEEDILGTVKYKDATGTISEGTKINLKEIVIAGNILYNVEASVVNTLEAPLLLGLSAISKLGVVQLDGNKLIINNKNAPVKSTDIKDTQGSPSDANTYNYRGIAKYDLQDYTGAIQDYSKAIQLNPDFADAYNNRGNAKQELKDYTGVIQDYNRAIQLKPNFTEAYNNRGNAKQELKDYTGAIQDYNRAIQLNPNFAEAYNNRGNAKQELKDYTGAIQDYNRAIQLNPNFTEAYNNRGNAKQELKDYTGAIQDYNRAIQLNPNFAEAYYNRGLSKYVLDDKNGACLDWSKAGELETFGAYDLIKKYCN